MLTACLQPPPRFHYERAQCVLANLFMHSGYYYICFYIVSEYVAWSWLMRSSNEVGPDNRAEFDVRGGVRGGRPRTVVGVTLARWPARRNVSTPHIAAGRRLQRTPGRFIPRSEGAPFISRNPQMKRRPFYPWRVIKETAMLPMNINTPAVLLWNGRVFRFIAGVWIQESPPRRSINYLCVCLCWLLLWPQYKLSNF